MGFVRLRPRPWPAEQNEELREEFRRKLEELACDSDVEIWFQDECGVMGDPKPTQVMARKGDRPIVKHTGWHIKESVLGAVRPDDGKFVSLIMPYVDANIFQIFLNEMSENIGEKEKVVMILDNATWHKARGLDWGRITPVYLPPYSPDLNPIERIWLYMKKSFFSLFCAKHIDQLTERLILALRFFIFNPDVCKSICGG
jgi:transposase